MPCVYTRTVAKGLAPMREEHSCTAPETPHTMNVYCIPNAFLSSWIIDNSHRWSLHTASSCKAKRRQSSGLVSRLRFSTQLSWQANATSSKSADALTHTHTHSHAHTHTPCFVFYVHECENLCRVFVLCVCKNVTNIFHDSNLYLCTSLYMCIDVHMRTYIIHTQTIS